jgi:hypothetical protein
MNIAEILSSDPALGATVTAVCAAVYKGTRAILEFHDEYLRKRRFKYLSYLTAESAEHTDLTEFIGLAKRESIFAAAFGRPASPRLALAIMSLYESKLFSLSELRACFLYMKVNESGAVDVTPGRSGAFVFILVSFLLVFMVFYVYVLVQELLALGSPPALAISTVIVVVFTSVGLFLVRDAVGVISAYKVGKRIHSYRASNQSLPSSGPLPAEARF